MDSLGCDSLLEVGFEALTLEVIKTSEIEGEHLSTERVRSSVARHLGIEALYQHQLVTPSYEVEASVEIMLKATTRFDLPLTLDEVCRWHHALFPQGLSGMYDINLGVLRDDANGLMQTYCDFANTDHQGDDFIHPIVKAIVLHFLLGFIHPFGDGNGRTARALFY